MNRQEEMALTPETAGKKPLVKSAKDFMTGMLSPLKTRDVGQMVEEFTAEMTLVAEGLSEDQQKLQEQQARLSVQQTEMEQFLLNQLEGARQETQALRKEISLLQNRLSAAEKAMQDKKHKKTEGLSRLIYQATWLVAIPSAAWVLTAIIRLFQ